MTDQPAAEAEAEAQPMYALESDKPLYSSMVWRLQRTFYGDQGVGAWSQPICTTRPFGSLLTVWAA